MEKYIKAGALIADLLSYAEANKGTYHEEGFKNAITVVEDQPSADVVERKKGKWIDPAAVDVYRCSICEEYTKLEVPRLFYHYCPNCGAKMEGGEDG